MKNIIIFAVLTAVTGVPAVIGAIWWSELYEFTASLWMMVGCGTLFIIFLIGLIINAVIYLNRKRDPGGVKFWGFLFIVLMFFFCANDIVALVQAVHSGNTGRIILYSVCMAVFTLPLAALLVYFAIELGRKD